MRTLGLILAGGQSRRFGSDKAEARLFGRTLLEHALERLRPHCDEIAVVGRETALARSIPDWPGPGLGPLGGLAGGFHHGGAEFDQILSVPVDAPRLPHDLRALLEPAPACFAGLPVIGLWPRSAAAAIEAILAGEGRRSMRALARAIGARLIEDAPLPPNINTPQDLRDLAGAG